MSFCLQAPLVSFDKIRHGSPIGYKSDTWDLCLFEKPCLPETQNLLTSLNSITYTDKYKSLQKLLKMYSKK